MLINIADVVDGALVSAIAVAGRRISVAVDGLRGRRRVSDLSAARWFETYRMTSEAPGLPELPAALTERLAELLRGEEAQAALHELLAARLTDAPEADATAARQVLSLTLTTADARAARFAEALAGYYDDQVCALVARLEADDPPGQLSQAAYLGAAAILPIMIETDLVPGSETLTLGPLEHIVPYLARRTGRDADAALPDLLVPDEFKQIFRDWADGRVSITEPD